MKILKTIAGAALATAALIATAGSVAAMPMTIPTALNPGDQYRLVFVTSTTRDAVSTDIADYNTFVDTLANSVTELADLVTSWTAIGTTSTVAARDNTSTVPGTDGSGIPIYLLDGTTQIATSYADLWDGTIAAPIDISESGIKESGTDFVWTGSNTSGFADGLRVLGRTGSGVAVTVGRRTFATGLWVDGGTTVKEDPNRRLYGISGVLAVPSPPDSQVPEPTTLTIFGLGLAGLGYMRRGRAA